jgi:uncharacterized protein GlcG (DUF336 family)
MARAFIPPEGADRKAYTARSFRAPSADFVKRMQNDPASVGSKEYTRVLALSGGLPIKVGDDVVGAVGVSGSPGKDDDCSQAGINKVAGPAQVSGRLRAATKLRVEAAHRDAHHCGDAPVRD